MKSELDIYLEEKALPKSGDVFDICNYRKVAGLKYPTLSMMARDIFGIHVSTIALESTFSTSGRHLGP